MRVPRKQPVGTLSPIPRSPQAPLIPLQRRRFSEKWSKKKRRTRDRWPALGNAQHVASLEHLEPGDAEGGVAGTTQVGNAGERANTSGPVAVTGPGNVYTRDGVVGAVATGHRFCVRG